MSDDVSNTANLARVALEKNLIEARLATLKLRVARGELVDRRKAELAMNALGLRIRDVFLTAPSRHAAVLAAEGGLDPAVLMAALDTAVRKALTRIADEAERRDQEEAA